jgi:SAM-dependent methyltransferase
MFEGSGLRDLGVSTWVDLGCGDGTFTLALAESLAARSVIQAIDRDCAALRGIPASHAGVAITTHCADFTSSAWPFRAVEIDGVLMANSLHYLAEPVPFLHACAARMTPRRQFLFVEYDTDRGNRWVPYPVSRHRLLSLFIEAGYPSASVKFLGTRRSLYQRAALYAALITL